MTKTEARSEESRRAFYDAAVIKNNA